MMNQTLSVHVAATPAENTAVLRAVEWWNDRLVEKGFADHTVEVTVAKPPLNGAEGSTADVIITSLLPEVGATDEAWPATEARLRKQFASLTRDGSRCCLFTIFRHVESDQPHGRLARIRRLNLLATDLSRQASLFVIDIDRALADVGSRAYDTDYQLQGNYAVEAVAREVAAVFMAVGFQGPLPRPTQHALEAALDAWQAPHSAPKTMGNQPARMVRGPRMPVFESEEKKLAHVIQQILQRRLPLREAWALFSVTARRKGLRNSVSMIMAGALLLLKRLAAAKSRFPLSPRR